MTKLLLAMFFLISLNSLGQQQVKFEVEKLAPPQQHLATKSYEDIYRTLILSDVKLNLSQIQKEKVDFPFNIVAKSEAPDSLVSFGYHSFFSGMYQAYAQHRPFVISPDMIWLLISQGFARHLNANPADFGKHFSVLKDRKLPLTVTADNLSLNSPASEWEKIFPQFTKQIATLSDKDFIRILTPEFSTTTPADKIATEITVMEATKPFFEFIVIAIVCGIPEITLKGTPQDWRELYKNAKRLEKYNLKWWTGELEPILKKMVETSEGNIDKDFWRNMFKYHSQEKYGSPKVIDGWIVKFFPYDKNGRRNNLEQLTGGDNLPDEIVKVDLCYIEASGNDRREIPLELWAGFIGLKQDVNDFTLSPQIGWMIRKKDVNNVGIKQKFALENNAQFGSIAIRVNEIPEEVFDFKRINNLEIAFIGDIIVPERLKKVELGILKLSGKISKPEIDRIRNMFPPSTQLIVNGELIDYPNQ
ncbi:DUF4419 domain-containing protein [Pelobium manganitolerans]|uniref:DUF4419 domain-containing protein n=1 Tax=Pelobium manganitolerans TaxID=1842495 RepID=UPI003FA34826